MKASPLTIESAEKLLSVELIKNGKGTQAVHDTVVGYQANRRSGTASTKTKGTVQKSGRKPWRQKGTGRARSGYFASPIWRGGGVVFGPHPRSYRKNTPIKVRRLALKKAIGERIKLGDVILVDEFKLKQAKTKLLLQALAELKVEGTILLVLEQNDPAVHLAARNHPAIDVITADVVNAEDILRNDRIVITEPSLRKIGARLVTTPEKEKAK